MEDPHGLVNGLEEEVPEEDGSEMSPVNSTDVWIKHPLKYKWAIWYYKPDRTRHWVENNVIIHTFATVEDFWCLYNGIVKASRLNNGCDFSVFKDGIQPMWEDPRNKRGGRWLINMNKGQRQADLDNVWLEMVLCLIGEAFDPHGDEVCGAVVNIRQKGDKLGMWTRNHEDKDVNMKVGNTLRARLNVPAKCDIVYQTHEDASGKTGSTVKIKYRV